MSKTVSVVVFVILMIAASRGLYLLMFRDSQGFSQGGNYSLWLTIGTAVIACIAGGLVFQLFRRHDRNKSSETPMVLCGPSTQSPGVNFTHKATTPRSFDFIAWKKQNPWLVEGQADDRMPMLGSAGDGIGSLSARRSTARQTHQMMYKKWSQARHDY